MSLVKSVEDQSLADADQRTALGKKLKRIPIMGLMPDEEEERIVRFCQILITQEVYSLADAAKGASLATREVALLRRKYPEFDNFINEYKGADDLHKADMANRNLHEGLLWRGRGGEIDRAISIYVDKSRGGYSERKQISVTGGRMIDPIDLANIPEAEEA